MSEILKILNHFLIV